MIRLPLVFALSVLGLSACRDDGISEPIHRGSASVTPTPTATPAPTATPGDDDGSDDGDDADLTPTPTPSPTPTSSSSTGAPMLSAVEQVQVVAVNLGIAGNSGDSTVQVARANGEVWLLGLTVTPNTQVGATIGFQDNQLIFGDLSGSLVFPDGNAYRISSSARIQ